MDDPWFTYLKGRGRMHISPRNGKGWASLVVFILLVTLPSFALPWLLGRSEWMLVPYIALVLVITVAFIRFAIGRSERVDLTMSASELAEFQAWKRRGKR